MKLKASASQAFVLLGLFLPLFALALLPPAVSGCRSGQRTGADAAKADSAIAARRATPQLAELSERILANPEEAMLYYERARAFEAYGNVRLALDDYSQALKLDSLNSEYAIALSNLLLEIGESKLALQMLASFRLRAPQNPAILYEFARVNLILKQYRAALSTLDDLLALDVQQAPAYLMKGMIFKAVGDTAQALSSLQTAVEVDPRLEDAYMELGLLHSARGDSVALRFYDAALRLNDTSYMARYGKARFLQDAGKFPGAIDLYNELIILDPQRADAIYNLATIYWGIDSVNKAYRLFDLTTRVDPTRASAYFGKGLCSEELGRPDEAALYYRQCLNLDADYEDARRRLDALEAS